MPKKKKASKRSNGTGAISYLRGKHVARVSLWTSGGAEARRKRPSKSFNTKAEAEAWIRMMLESPLDLDAEKVTVASYVERWLEDAADSLAPATYTKYSQNVRLRITPHIGSVRLVKLTPAHIRSWVRELSKTLKAGSVRHALATLRIALNQALSDGLIDKSPAVGVKPPKATKEEMRCLSEEEAARLIEVVRGTRYEAYYLTALKAGLRQGELGGLFWEDIDLEYSTLTVSRSVYVEHGRAIWGSTKTGEERRITLGTSILDALRRHRKLQQEEKLACPERWQDVRLIFPNEVGGVKTRSTTYKAFRGHLEAAGLEKMRFHDLRDTFASLALGLGIQLHVVADILGHKDPAMTLRRYAHVLPSMSEDAARKLGSLNF